ncbi:zf-HC2 domain-containing protein, partial [Nocardia sp. NPDC004582]
MTEGHELCDGYTTWDGAYVLGALARDDRREYEEHLTGCDSCRSAVSKLAGLPGLLALVDPDTALSVAAQPDPPESVPPPPERLRRDRCGGKRCRRIRPPCCARSTRSTRPRCG